LEWRDVIDDVREDSEVESADVDLMFETCDETTVGVTSGEANGSFVLVGNHVHVLLVVVRILVVANPITGA
jgi:hypothetical protein